ncbi:LacI family DNA-binding transcriptional regulator [Bacillota bacterium Meth-B3]|nr:LacI family DNA-binding transcriptional regulator [Christensenellaceae bacterium]MEA5066059.1 LacI family DNA-binding transcriptional regulator [Eubacteriales bacterium]MEA5069071.1 LacI family DNA-binding transcriptional regulator [Christensenellaceae bacterium]
MNIREFAAYCDVSPATISRYFSGSASMSPELNERIRRSVQKTGYQPSAKYQRRKSGLLEPIVTVIPYLHHRFQLDILSELQKYCDELERSMLILCYHEKQEPSVCLTRIRALSPAGVVLLHEGGDTLFYKSLSDLRIPLVVCSGLSATRQVSSVRIDDLAAAYDGANYLLRLGHRNIGIISDKAEAIGSGSQRIMGCRKALADAGLALPEENIAYAWYSFEDGYRGMETLLGRNLGITAAFVFSDEMAAGAMACLHDHGVKTPDDISVLGFDNGSQALETRPALSTVAQPVEQIARRSIDKLLEPGGQNVESITLPHTIAIRESCRKL